MAAGAEKALPWDPAHCTAPETSYDGPHKRPVPHDDGVWFKKTQVWHDRRVNSKVGAWRWSRGPLGDG